MSEGKMARTISQALRFWWRMRAPALLTTLFAVLSVPAGAQQNDTAMAIAAVVNEDVITEFDVRSRVQLFVATSGIENTPEIQQRLVPQVINTLIEERLKLQEAESFEVETTDEEILQAVRDIESRNGMRPGSFRALLEEQGVNVGSLYAQIEADVAWSKVVRGALQREVNIAPEEVETVMAKLQANQGKPDYLAAEIVLPVNPSAPDASVRQLAEQLILRLQQGTPFANLAQQFSQSPTAAVGGDLGWVLAGDLERELDQTLANMVPGQVSPPIRTASGYHILYLQDRRSAGAPDPRRHILSLSQIYLPTIGGRSIDPIRMARLSNRIQTEVSNC
ncbi:MAG: peptidylprolyl isomerase, partial [Rhodospirillaceae bacterium]